MGFWKSLTKAGDSDETENTQVATHLDQAMPVTVLSADLLAENQFTRGDSGRGRRAARRMQRETGVISTDNISRTELIDETPVDVDITPVPAWDTADEIVEVLEPDAAPEVAAEVAPDAITAPQEIIQPIDEVPTESKPEKTPEERTSAMAKLDETIKELLKIEGALAAAIVEAESGMALASEGNPGFSLDVAAAGNSNVVRAKLKTMKDLGIQDKGIDDVLISLSDQYHLINVLSNAGAEGLFIYLVLSRESANLALARFKLKAAAQAIEV